MFYLNMLCHATTGVQVNLDQFDLTLSNGTKLVRFFFFISGILFFFNFISSWIIFIHVTLLFNVFFLNSSCRKTNFNVLAFKNKKTQKCNVCVRVVHFRLNASFFFLMIFLFINKTCQVNDTKISYDNAIIQQGKNNNWYVTTGLWRPL